MAPRNDQSVISIVVADEQLEMRRLVRTSLQRLEKVEYDEYKEFDKLKEDLTFSWPDLIIVSTDLPGGDVCELIRAIRYNEIGNNPFVPIVATTWSKERSSLRKIINAGVDSVLMKPLSAGAIAKYVDMISKNRKSFVVTSSYIGPDRRNLDRRDDTIPHMDVPNTFKAKRAGEIVNIADLNSWISKELETFSAERLRSNAIEISRLLVLIVKDFERGSIGENAVKGLGRIKEIATDLSERARKDGYDHISSLCDNLVKVAKALASDRLNPKKKDLQLIKPLCDAILLGLEEGHEGSEEKALAAEIASSVSEARATG